MELGPSMVALGIIPAPQCGSPPPKRTEELSFGDFVEALLCNHWPLMIGSTSGLSLPLQIEVGLKFQLSPH